MTEIFVAILFFLVFILLVAAWNGFVIRWYENLRKNVPASLWTLEMKANQKKLSGIWHKIGWWVRAVPAIPVFMYWWEQWYVLYLVGILYVNFGYTVYDAVVNMTLKRKLISVGSTAQIDKIGKRAWIVKLILFLAIIPAIVLYFIK